MRSTDGSATHAARLWLDAGRRPSVVGTGPGTVVTLLAAVAVVFGTAGALGFYLASPNQKLRVRHLPPRFAVGLGAAGVLLSLLVFLQVAGPATSVYLLLTLVMFVWSVVPLIVGWWRYRRSRDT